MKAFRSLPAFRFGVWVPLLLISAMLVAAEPRKTGPWKTSQPKAEAETVDLFPAIEKGQIEARLTAKNADLCILVIRNLGDQPLTVQFPEAFGGVPSLAQQSGNRQTGSQTGSQDGSQALVQSVGNPGSTQALGMAPPGSLYQPGGTTGGMIASLDVPAGGQRRLVLRSVCLERFKRGPSARIPYEIKPLKEITDKPEVFELCRLISLPAVNMRMVQAAAWHVNNGLDWNKMLQRGTMGPFSDPSRFTQFELLGAQRLTLMAEQAARQRAGSEAGGEASSSPPSPAYRQQQ